MRQQIDKEYDRNRIPQAYDLLSRYEAMHEIERQHPEALKLGWGITILLVLIELFPTLIKLTTPYSAYMALVEAREREDIQRFHSMGNRNMSQLPMAPFDSELSVIDQAVTVRQEQEESGHEKKRRSAVAGR